MRIVLATFLLLASTAISAGNAPGSPGTATPQPSAPPVLQTPANPDRPPLLRMPAVRHNQPEPAQPVIERYETDSSPRAGDGRTPPREEARPTP